MSNERGCNEISKNDEEDNEEETDNQKNNKLRSIKANCLLNINLESPISISTN